MSNELNRRDFLTAGAVGALLVPAAGLADASPVASEILGEAVRPIPPGSISKFTEPLAIPPTADVRLGGRRVFAMRRKLHQFHRALGLTPAFGYGGLPYLGPTLLARRGVPVELVYVNDLRDHPLAPVIDLRVPDARRSDRTRPRASVHLHGGRSAPPSDGHPLDWFQSGSAHRYFHGNDQEAASLWYHDHADGITRLNVYAGLAGVYWLRDEWDTGQARNGPGLPHGRYEIPLVIQDKSFAARRGGSALFYPRREPGEAAQLPPGSPRIWVPEFFGDTAVVNGKVWPVLQVDGSVYRLRLVNGAESRFFHLFFDHGPAMWQIGSDQGLLDAPTRLNDGLLLAPGERADLLIDFARTRPGQEWVLRNDAPAPFPGGSDAPRLGEIMKFVRTPARGPFHHIPHRLRPAGVPALATTGVTRNTTLQERLTHDELSFGPLINGVPFHGPDRDIIHARRGAVELWNIINLTGDAHPIHLHLVAFQIRERVPFAGPAGPDGVPRGVNQYIRRWHVNPDSRIPIPGYGVGADHSAEPYLDHRQARPPAPGERGWKDTVVCPPGQVTRILVPFTGLPFRTDEPYQTQSGRPVRGYVWHCHILEHEDFDMMQRYRIV